MLWDGMDSGPSHNITDSSSLKMNKGHRARLCPPLPNPKWDPSLLSLQGWDSIPSQGGHL